MAKGLFTQCVCLLTDGRPSIDDIKRSLPSLGVTSAKDVVASEHHEFSGPAIVIPYRPEVNGYVAVDVVDQAWPDAMGDPQTDAVTFGAWSMGQFGPFTFPSGLARATQHAWNSPQCKALAASHRGYIRLRMSYVFGSSSELQLLPADYEASAELSFLLNIVKALMSIDGVLCYFDPGGEVLSDRLVFDQIFSGCLQQHKLPLALWSNIRLWNLDNEFGCMDTVGNQQLDGADIEAIYPKAAYSPTEIDYFLRNVTQYLLESKPEFRTGQSIDGPGESNLSWVVHVAEEPLVVPPRPTIRLCPADDFARVQRAIASALKC